VTSTGSIQVREASIAIKVIRADGTIEDRGVVSYYHRNPLRRLWHSIKQNFRENWK
jgi:hypothetical protein